MPLLVKPKNRRTRRQHLQPARRYFRDVAAKPVEEVRRFWRGRCECPACNGAACPHVYAVWVEFPGGVPGGTGNRTTVGYECWLNDHPEHWRESPGGPSSASAAALRWVEDRFVGGVKVDLREVEIEPEADESLEAEVARHASLMEYLAATCPDDRAVRAGELRYAQLCRTFAGRKAARRLRQWLHNEFPGWSY